MLKIWYCISALLLVNVSLWYVNVSAVRKRMTSCQKVPTSSTSSGNKHRYSRFTLPFKAKTNYPKTRGIRYLLNNENICNTTRPVDLLYVVSSSPIHDYFRRVIRSTFANSSYFRNNIVRVVFFVGTPTKNITQAKLKKEHTKYGDIIQSDFVDAYKNLTMKVVRELHWLTTYCHDVRIVAKIDDDAFVDTVLFLLKYKSYITSGKYDILGNRLKTFINRKGKWGVLDTLFRGYTSFPWAYCSGYAVFIRGELISKLLKAASISPFFWIDDLYISGILPSWLKKVQIKEIPNYLQVSKRNIGCFMNKKCKYVFGLINNNYISEVWNYTVNEKHGKKMLLV